MALRNISGETCHGETMNAQVIPPDGGRLDLGAGSFVDYSPGFINAEEADGLFRGLVHDVEWEQHYVDRGRTRPQPRLVKWFGDFAYSYSGITHDRAAWPPRLLDLRKRIEETVFGAALCQYQGVLLNYYRNGRDSVGFHADDEPMIRRDSPIASVSLGDERLFLLRSKHGRDSADEEIRVVLRHGSLIIMGGTMQRHWLHSIPKRPNREGGRVNLTFREYESA